MSGRKLSSRPSVQNEVRDLCIPVVVGDRVVMEEAVRLPGLSVKLNIIREPGEAKSTPGFIDLIDLATLNSFEKKMPTVRRWKGIRSLYQEGC